MEQMFYCDKNFTNGKKPTTFCPLCVVCKKKYLIDLYMSKHKEFEEEERKIKEYEKAVAKAKRDFYIIPLPPPTKQITIFD